MREQVEAALPAGASWEVVEAGLAVRAAGRAHVYALTGPQSAEEDVPAGWPARAALVFRARPVPWEGWVGAWENDLAGKGHGAGLLPGAALLPAEARSWEQEARAPWSPPGAEGPSTGVKEIGGTTAAEDHR